MDFFTNLLILLQGNIDGFRAAFCLDPPTGRPGICNDHKPLNI